MYIQFQRTRRAGYAETETQRMGKVGGRIVADKGDIRFEIVERIGVLERHENGWNREINVVSWNGGEPKLDIREWSRDHERMTRGITLSEEQGRKLSDALNKRYVNRDNRKLERTIEER